MLAQRNRFHGHGSLRFLYKNGQAERSRTITLKHIENPRRKHTRVAVVISKKVLKSAVLRNRVRRRVYEIIRQDLPQLDTSYDLVFLIFSGEVLTMPHDELLAQMKHLTSAAGIYKNQR
ncbi:MAG: ribonuclease P protein component [Chloroflexi bacterium]|nr:MAG: ribonuclease P protein component [Chloroflexota bacterium]